MSQLQPQHHQQLVKPGYYPDRQGVMRWWDGREWTSYTQQVQRPEPRLPDPYVQPVQPAHQTIQINQVSGGVARTVGLSTGEHVFHAVMTVLTLGLWLFVWVPRALFARRRLS
jgi:hypothetical protein